VFSYVSHPDRLHVRGGEGEVSLRLWHVPPILGPAAVRQMWLYEGHPARGRTTHEGPGRILYSAKQRQTLLY
jgi:hypothetical protein